MAALLLVTPSMIGVAVTPDCIKAPLKLKVAGPWLTAGSQAQTTVLVTNRDSLSCPARELSSSTVAGHEVLAYGYPQKIRLLPARTAPIAIMLDWKGHAAPDRSVTFVLYELRVGKPGPQIISHRGASGLLPENTLRSFSAAGLLGADAVEFDVRPSREGVPAIMHDPTVNRTTNGAGRVDALAWDSLSRLRVDINSGDDPVPTISDALRAIPNSVTAVIDLKGQSRPAVVLPAVRDAANKGRPLHRVLLISTSQRLLAHLRSAAPELPLGLVWFKNNPAEMWTAIERTGPSAVLLYHRTASPEVLRELDRRGINTYIWTVDSPRFIKKWMQTEHVDGVITDRPEQAIQMRHQLYFDQIGRVSLAPPPPPLLPAGAASPEIWPAGVRPD